MRLNNCFKISLSILLGLAMTAALLQLLPTQAAPVLSVSGSGSDSFPGGEVTYRLELLNHTDQIVYDGLITAILPPGFSYISGSTTLLGEGWPMESREPLVEGQTLTWGPYHLPAAGIKVHNPYGVHTLMDSCDGIPALHLEGARMLAGNGGYVTQLFYPIDTATTGPSQCVINFVNEAYARNLIPILRLQGHRVNGIWQAPSPGPNGDYAQIAQAYANYVSGLPRRDTNPLYIEVWNEPDLWIEWSGQPNASQYARFFVAVSNAIRGLGDARIRLVNGALTPGNTAFIDRMLRVPGFRDAFDMWASHCYPYNHPAWYNNHSGTARYGTYAIDCYLEELAVIKRYGRSNVKVILTETGYELGNNLYAFEGFPAINQTNRADYISSAFKDYWQQWPEIVAVTPFQLTDQAGLWHKFDWVQPTAPYTPHLQFSRVTALPKPAGQLEPYGYQVMFKAGVGANVPTGTYTLALSGSERSGVTVVAAPVATITVRDPVPLQYTYLPVILKPLPSGGAFYQLDTPLPSSPINDGAIIPSHFLTASLILLDTPPAQTFDLSGEPLALAIDPATGLVAILLADGRLQIFDSATNHFVDTLTVGDLPQAIAPGPPGQVYVGLSGAIVQVDLQSRQVVNRVTGLGRPRGLAWDIVTHRLFAADAQTEQLLILSDDLTRQLAALPLPEQPNLLLLDAAARHLYLTFPGVPQIIALNADTLIRVARHTLTGGPILDVALSGNRLYALNALAPTQRGLTVLQTPALTRLALVAGSEPVPLQSATAMAAASGQLLFGTDNALLRVEPDSFAVQAYPLPAPALGLSILTNGGIIGIDQTHLFRINP